MMPPKAQASVGKKAKKKGAAEPRGQEPRRRKNAAMVHASAQTAEGKRRKSRSAIQGEESREK